MLITAVSATAFLVVGAGTGLRQESDPVSAAEQRCGGALGGGPDGEVADCFRREVSKSRFAVALPWLAAATLADMATLALHLLRDL